MKLKKNIKEQQTPQEYTPKQQKLIKIINALQNGNIDLDFIEDYTGGIESFIEKLENENLLHLIDPFDNVWEDIQNGLFYSFYQVDPKFIWKLVNNYLSDVVEKNGKYYLVIDGDDLSNFFETNWGYGVSKETIANIIDGESNDYHYYDVSDNPYRDIYEYLTTENKKRVVAKIILVLKKLQKLEVTNHSPSLFDDIAKKQNKDGEFELTDEVITELLSDDDSLEFLINRELYDEIGTDLYSTYEGCYSSVLENSYYHSIMGELEGYIIDNYKSDTYSYEKTVYDKEGNPQKKMFHIPMYEATNCIYDIVSEWLSYNKEDSTNIDNYATLRDLLENMIYHGERDNLRQPRFDDYPDHRELIKCVNESIGDYF